ncbi:MAG: GNAT family N-acetyltransferase [Clostridiales bacterium]|nr:GNAT family N-acetyltransferase [Clostridiales bacterium]
MYYDIDEYFEYFWCLFDEENMIGTVALKKINDEHCELKSLYLLEQYHKKGLGYQLLKTAILKAGQDGYKEMYLDTLSSSTKAISLYEKMGFVRIERYNNNYAADVFMVLKLDS